ncbi:MAG: tetratricopeptide repeat protein, partial [Candidatus Wallbacteria bacterium]|nr:tetratricopeptide repeat protein [Candidatus Wallbacteria bacterium]
ADCLESESEKQFQDGVSLYRDKKYPEAAKAFQGIADRLRDPDIYYNLGNAYFKSGRLGSAIQYYEKSLRIRYDKDARSNLDYAISSTKDKIHTEETLLEKYLLRLNPDLFFNLSTLLLMFVGSLTALRVWKKTVPLALILTLGVFTLILFSTSAAGYLTRNQELAVILNDQQGVFVGPSLEEAVSFKLNEGARVKVIEHQENWLRISLPNGLSGWIEAQAAGLI